MFFIAALFVMVDAALKVLVKVTPLELFYLEVL